MAGINTLIDTVLHSVLGRRVDIQPQRDLNQPVRPMDPAQAPPQVRSDSRLNPRSSPYLDPLGREPGQTRPGPRPTLPEGAPPPSTRASFSPAARAIAEVLARFPSPPSVLRSETPLLQQLPATQPGAAIQGGGATAVSASQLAGQLQTSINDSGLFYESQLARWYRGEVPREQLARQPQMQWAQAINGTGHASSAAAADSVRQTAETLRALVQPGTAGPGNAADLSRAAPPTAGPEAPAPAQNQVTAYQRAAMQAPAAQPGGAAAAERGEAESARAAAGSGAERQDEGSRPLRSADLPEPLQGLVRHQLELLATPILRWEGDIWSGLFMALMIQLPGGGRDQDEPASGEQQQAGDEEDEASAWRSELTLEVAGLGEVRANVQLRERQLRLVLQARDPNLLATLESGRAELLERLQNSAGFADTHVRVRELAATGGTGEPAS